MMMKMYKKGECCVLFHLFFPSSAKHKSQKITFHTHTHTHTHPYTPALSHRILTPRPHTAQASHPSSTISSHHTSITMSASKSKSTAKRQQIYEYDCTIEAFDVDEDCKRPFVTVRTRRGDFLTTDDKGHERQGGPRMKIYVERDSPFAVMYKEVTVVCSRDRNSMNYYSVSIKSKD